jgi:tetratricopeptide (TPR) repeat protein
MQAERVLEMGKLNCDRGDYASAIPLLKEAAVAFYSEKNFPQYLKCQNFLLRVYAEMDRPEDIQSTKESLQDLVMKEGFELNAKTYYTLAACASLRDQNALALDYGQKALALGLANDSKEDICHAIFIIARTYSTPEYQRYSDALKEIYNLQVFFQVYDLPDLKASTQILNAHILHQMKRYEEAIEVAWKAYDDLKNSKSLALATYLLILMGAIYIDLGEKDMARMYLNLAQKSLDPKNQVRLNRMVQGYADKLGREVDQNVDLFFDEISHSVTEKKLGKIDFKNQFILLDLLRLFVLNQGTVYSKEFLVENVWKQSYDPAVHDNKIYVTIKRLRKMIEPDYEKPKYIFRAKNGYYMNKSARIHLEV